MITATWRLVAYNATGVALGASDSITVTGTLSSVSSTGTLSETTNTSLVSGGASLTSAGTLLGSTQNATPGTTWMLEADCFATATISTATPAGAVNLYVQFSQDGGTTWPATAQGGIFIGSLTFIAVGTVNGNIKLAI